MQPTASIYVRLSKQAKESNLSRDGMVDDCRKLCDRMGFRVAAVHVDDGISGSVRDRPAFLAWLADAKEGRATVLVPFHADRITREGMNSGAMVLDVLEGKDPTTGRVVSNPVRLVDTTGLDSAGDSLAFRLQFLLRAEVAREERQRMKERNTDAKRRMKGTGRYQGGPIPYGSRVVLRDGRKFLAPEAAEAAILQQAAEKMLAGAPTLTVCRWMNGQGARTRRNGPWTPPTLRNTLRLESVRDHVLDPTVWLAIGQMVGTRPPANRTGIGRPPANLLVRGQGRCGKCRSNLTTIRYKRTKSGEEKRRYVCKGGSDGICTGLSIDATATDDHVSREYLARWGDKPVVAIVKTWAEQDALRLATQEVDEAREALQRGEPSMEKYARWEAAKGEQQRLQAAVTSSEPRTNLRVEDYTMGEEWERATSPDERWRLLREALANSKPITVLPEPSRVGRSPNASPVADRVVIDWGEDD